MKLFDRYIAATVLATTLVVGLVIVALYTFITFLTELGETGEGSYSAFEAAQFVLLGTPQALYQVFPIVVLIGTLMGLGALAGGSELIVLRASGVSVLRLTGAALHAGVVLALVCFAVGNWVAPAGQQLAQQIRVQAQSAGGGRVAGESLWLRQNSSYVHIGRLPASDRALDVVIYELAPDRAVQSIVSAARADYQGGDWYLSDVSITRFSGRGVSVERRDTLVVEATVEPELLRLFVVQPENLSVLGLYRYARYMESNEIGAARYRLAFWRKLAAPVTVLVMIVLAVPFVLGGLRSAGAGQRLFVGVLAGIAFFTVNEIVANVGQVLAVAPWLTAWSPTVVLAVLAFWRLRHSG